MFYVVAFNPIRFLICYTPSNDHLNLIFVKYIHAVCEKMTRNGPKIVTLKYGSNFIASDVSWIDNFECLKSSGFSGFLEVDFLDYYILIYFNIM